MLSLGLAGLAGFFDGFDCGGGQSNALFEPVYVSGGVNELLFAGVKRVALAADFRVNFGNG